MCEICAEEKKTSKCLNGKALRLAVQMLYQDFIGAQRGAVKNYKQKYRKTIKFRQSQKSKKDICVYR